MFQNFLTTAIRNFFRQPGYTLLNILGLTLGVTATLFILLYLTEELSFDRHHELADRIYRISSDITEPDDAFKWAVTQFPLAPTLREEYPEVEAYARFVPNGRTRVAYRDDNFFTDDVFLVDSTVFDIFSFEFVAGDPATALDRPNCIVLDETLAKRIFGPEDPVGKYLENDSGQPYEVTGVFRDMPRQSHLLADALLSSSTIEDIQNAGSWGGFGVYSYVLLQAGTKKEAFERKLQEIIDLHVATIFDQFNIKIKYVLVPLLDIHLKSDFQNEPEPVGKMAFIYIFGVVAFLILLIACINYMNLATARSTQRALEVGLRKVLGSERRQLIWQFLAESVLLTLVAVILAFSAVVIWLPVFNRMFGLELGYELLYAPIVLTGTLVILILLGLAGGSYPAFYLSGFRPIAVLKGKLARGSGNPGLRKVLVSLQFAITLFMLIGTGVIFDQMHYIRNKALGFDKEKVLTFEMAGREARQKWPVIRESLLQNPNILSAGSASSTPGQGAGRLVGNIESANGEMEQLGLALYSVDYDFFPTMNVEITRGRNFSREYSTDSSRAVLVNEAMVERMKWEDPIGRKIQFGSNDTLPVSYVIGVVHDFHQQALYDPIEPLMFLPQETNRYAHVRFKGDITPVIDFMERIWQEAFPDQPFEYHFVDESLRELYEADEVRSQIFTMFSVLMIVIACLGLLGLASFTAEQRTKEIGIRKVIGAGIADLVFMLTRDYLLLISIAALPAFLAAWYFMSRWLDTFTYHTAMNFWLFPLALILTIGMALLTTGYHALRAARRNPVEALRYE